MKEGTGEGRGGEEKGKRERKNWPKLVLIAIVTIGRWDLSETLSHGGGGVVCPLHRLMLSSQAGLPLACSLTLDLHSVMR